jgi:hypothetical protein
MADYWKHSFSGTLGELVAGLRNSSRILKNNFRIHIQYFSIITCRNCKMSFQRSSGLLSSMLQGSRGRYNPAHCTTEAR